MKHKNQLAILDKNQLMTVKVSDKGQITLPTLIQRMLEIKKGDKLVLYAEHNKILLKKVNEIISQMSDDFKDMEHYTEESLKEFWQNEPEGVWERYLKPKQKRKTKLET
jgi:AbrB family looped-hinge helix DNA binding protein